MRTDQQPLRIALFAPEGRMGNAIAAAIEQDPNFELDKWAKKAKAWVKKGDAFIYFISGANVRNPAAAQALQQRLGIAPA